MNEYQYADGNSPLEHSAEAVLALLNRGVINREEARRLLGLTSDYLQNPSE